MDSAAGGSDAEFLSASCALHHKRRRSHPTTALKSDFAEESQAAVASGASGMRFGRKGQNVSRQHLGEEKDNCLELVGKTYMANGSLSMRSVRHPDAGQIGCPSRRSWCRWLG